MCYWDEVCLKDKHDKICKHKPISSVIYFISYVILYTFIIAKDAKWTAHSMEMLLSVTAYEYPGYNTLGQPSLDADTRRGMELLWGQ